MCDGLVRWRVNYATTWSTVALVCIYAISLLFIKLIGLIIIFEITQVDPSWILLLFPFCIRLYLKIWVWFSLSRVSQDLIVFIRLIDIDIEVGFGFLMVFFIGITIIILTNPFSGPWSLIPLCSYFVDFLLVLFSEVLIAFNLLFLSCNLLFWRLRK